MKINRQRKAMELFADILGAVIILAVAFLIALFMVGFGLIPDFDKVNSYEHPATFFADFSTGAYVKQSSGELMEEVFSKYSSGNYADKFEWASHLGCTYRNVLCSNSTNKNECARQCMIRMYSDVSDIADVLTFSDWQAEHPEIVDAHNLAGQKNRYLDYLYSIRVSDIADVRFSSSLNEGIVGTLQIKSGGSIFYSDSSFDSQDARTSYLPVPCSFSSTCLLEVNKDVE